MLLPAGFVYLSKMDASIIQDIKYFSHDNFIGRPIAGYEAAECILTIDATNALLKVQAQLKQQSLGLKVFDGYRPQTAVNDFIAWCREASDQKMKQDYYPRVNKADFFKLDYLAEKSGHSRGSTIDLTIIHLDDQRELDMGTRFDFLDELSHPLTGNVNAEAKQNRLLLRSLMEEAGFRGVETEWWHFTLKNEPFPDTYFDFPVI